MHGIHPQPLTTPQFPPPLPHKITMVDPVKFMPLQSIYIDKSFTTPKSCGIGNKEGSWVHIEHNKFTVAIDYRNTQTPCKQDLLLFYKINNADNELNDDKIDLNLSSPVDNRPTNHPNTQIPFCLHLGNNLTVN